MHSSLFQLSFLKNGLLLEDRVTATMTEAGSSSREASTAQGQLKARWNIKKTSIEFNWLIYFLKI